MKKVTIMSALLLSGISLLSVLYTQEAAAQMIIGASPASLNANSMLQVESADKGVLFPRVALSNTSSASPLAAHVAGMVVYNTVTANDVVPGLYQNDGLKWSKLIGGGGAAAGPVNSITLEVGQTYHYVTTMPPTLNLELDGSINPRTGQTNHAPVIDSIMITLKNTGTGQQGWYNPHLKNLTGNTVIVKYTGTASVNNNYTNSTATITAGGTMNLDANTTVNGGNNYSELLRGVIMINYRWYEFRVTTYGGQNDANSAAITERNVSISITRMG